VSVLYFSVEEKADMRNNFHRTLLICVPLLLTACGDPYAPTIPDPQIATTAISSTSVSISWSKATDTQSDASELVYKVYLSGANPAYQSFDTIAEVEAGTLVETLTDASSTTISSGISAGDAYYINIVVLDEEGNQALYDPLGEYFHAGQNSYYPFNGDGNDAITATANHLAVATGLALPTVTSDRFGHTGSAYNFTPATTPQCLQSTATVGIDINDSRSVSFWVQSSNTSASTRRVPFAWGDGGTDGSNFGVFESEVDASWVVWLGGSTTVSTTAAVTSNWEHWVISYDSATNKVYTYKNGAAPTSGTMAVANTEDTLLYVGCGKDTGSLSYPYQGNIDDVRVFNQLLGPTDVARLYAVTRP
jgi:hypothetical protein